MVVMIHWFDVELLVMFGKESASGVMRDDWSPLSLLSYQEWDQEVGPEGVQSRQETAQFRSHQDQDQRHNLDLHCARQKRREIENPMGVLGAAQASSMFYFVLI
jgi:hypothetical protein